GEVAVDPPDQLLCPRAVRGEEFLAYVTALPAVVRLVAGPVLGLRRGVDELGALFAARQRRAGRQGVKVDAGLAASPSRRTSAAGSAGDDEHERNDDPAETAATETAATETAPAETAATETAPAETAATETAVSRGGPTAHGASLYETR